MPHFIRVYNSEGGVTDLTLGAAALMLRSNGSTADPSFERPAGEQVRHMFSYTQRWEAVDVARVSGADYGVGNFTSEFERGSGSGDRFGPACYTTPSDHPFTQRV